MEARHYYQQVSSRLKNCFQFGHYVVATGRELAQERCDPIFPALAAPLDQLDHLTQERGLQVHLPIIGARSCAVLMPLDIEIFLAKDNYRLYTDALAQKKLFQHILPQIEFVEELLRSRGIPHLLDYTPSGCHILFQNLLGYRATEEVRKIGFVERDLAAACSYRDARDIRRWYGVSPAAAQVFSGLGKLAEYIALLAMKAFRERSGELLPLTISDSAEQCINFDNTWSEGSPFMRTIRSPFSLHKKNIELYGNSHQSPLVDVIGSYFDGRAASPRKDPDYLLECMWDLEKAAQHAESFTGYIPCSNETLIDFINEYKSSALYAFHREFEEQHDLPRGRALEYARREGAIPDWTRNILRHPNPAALQPKNLVGFIYDFLIRAQWQPRHIANILRDLYQNPSFNWVQDFFKYPAEEKANFWARTYSAMTLFRLGQLPI